MNKGFHGILLPTKTRQQVRDNDVGELATCKIFPLKIEV